MTDHRIKLTLHKLDSVMNGDLDEIIDSLIAADQAAKLANMKKNRQSLRRIRTDIVCWNLILRGPSWRTRK